MDEYGQLVMEMKGTSIMISLNKVLMFLRSKWVEVKS